jgi:hypothetical protein
MGKYFEVKKEKAGKVKAVSMEEEGEGSSLLHALALVS